MPGASFHKFIVFLLYGMKRTQATQQRIYQFPVVFETILKMDIQLPVEWPVNNGLCKYQIEIS